MGLVVHELSDLLGKRHALVLCVGEAVVVAHLHEDVVERLLLIGDAHLLEGAPVLLQVLHDLDELV